MNSLRRKLNLDQKELAIYIEKANSLISIGDFDQCMNFLFDLAIKFPDDYAIVKMLGFSFFLMKMYGVSVACQDRLLEIKPDSLDVLKAKNILLQKIISEQNNKFCLQNNTQIGKEDLDTTVIILCGGVSNRWKNFQNVTHKSLMTIEGEVLLNRTLRQVKAYDPKNLFVAVNPSYIELFKRVIKVKADIAVVEKTNFENESPAWKYLSSKSLWNPLGYTICILGDVWFSDEAIEKIFTENNMDWISFGRFGPSKFTGYPYPNFFGLKFRNYNSHLRNLDILDKLYHSKICKTYGAGWSLTQMMRNESPNQRVQSFNMINIDDFTDDFDTGNDYERWVSHRKLRD